MQAAYRRQVQGGRQGRISRSGRGRGHPHRGEGHRRQPPEFYVLRILDTDRKIMVPVANASAVGLRQVISEQEIREIFDILRERTIAFDNQTWNRRYRGFMDKIKTGSIYDVAEVLRDLYRLKTDKQLSLRRAPHARHGAHAHREGDRHRPKPDRGAGQDRDRSDLRRELTRASDCGARSFVRRSARRRLWRWFGLHRSPSPRQA